MTRHPPLRFLALPDWIEVASRVTGVPGSHLVGMTDLHLLSAALDAPATVASMSPASPVAMGAGALLVRLARTPPLLLDSTAVAAVATDMFLSGNGYVFVGGLGPLADKAAASRLDVAQVAALIEEGLTLRDEETA